MLVFDANNWKKNTWIIIDMNLTDFLFELPDDTDEQTALFNCLSSYFFFFLLIEDALTAMASLSYVNKKSWN